MKPSSSRPHVAVVGAGAFGGWTALHLLRRGARVTLLDAWGPGNSRASSGGETRVIRTVYGADRAYVDWTARSFPQWREAEASWKLQLYRRTGALWMCEGDEGYVRSGIPLAEDAGLRVVELGVTEARRRFPQIDFDEVRSTFFEEEAGYLFARRACRAVAAAVAAEGGEVRHAAVAPGPIRDGAMARLEVPGDEPLAADLYVFACGPWLGRLFPEVIGEKIQPTRQEIYFFGPPAGDRRFGDDVCPVWFDLGERIIYGIPGNEHRGFKVADDTRGEPFDPTAGAPIGDRAPTPALLAIARAFLARRFPTLADAPLVEARVCQYENSPDGHLLFDRHPDAANVWFLGGGSGHGFKFGPALGEYAANVILKEETPFDFLALDRPGLAPGGTLKTQFER